MNGTTNNDRTNYLKMFQHPHLILLYGWNRIEGHLLGAITQEILDEQRGVVQNEKGR